MTASLQNLSVREEAWVTASLQNRATLCVCVRVCGCVCVSVSRKGCTLAQHGEIVEHAMF